MAIVKVGTYRNPPVDITDYEAIAAHLEAYTRQIGNQGMILTEWTNHTTQPKIAMGSYISHGGVLYVVDTEDYVLPALSSDGTYYLRVAASGDTLAITYTTNIADYSWNAAYGGLYHADESQVLPYQVVKNGALVEKYKMLNPWQNDDFSVVNYLGRYHGRELRVTGAISGASLNTGSGAMTFDQGVKTTDNVVFASIDTGNGASEVYPFSNLTLSGDSSVHIPAMALNQILFVKYEPISTVGYLKTPTDTGTYLVIGGVGEYPTSSNYTRSGIFGTSAEIARLSSNGHVCAVIILRIS